MTNGWRERVADIAAELDREVPKEGAAYDLSCEDENSTITGNPSGLARLATEMLKAVASTTPEDTPRSSDPGYAGPVAEIVCEEAYVPERPRGRTGWDVLGLIGCAIVFMIVMAIFTRGCSSLYKDVRQTIGENEPTGSRQVG